MPAPLVTLQKYKAAIRDTTSGDDPRHVEALEDASDAVRSYTDRDFASVPVTESRVFYYEGDGRPLEVDDTFTVNTVTLEGSTAPLAATRWRAGFDGPNGTPYTYIWLPTYRQESGEMGFMYNLDVFLAQHGNQLPLDIQVTVNAVWGWATVPDAVQRATIWIASTFEQDPSIATGGLSSKSVAEVAESYARSEQTTDEPFPKRARLLLDAYKRHL